jgi:hypothetical protein
MEHVRFAVRFTSLALLALLAGGYVFLVYRGDIPRPNFQAIADQVAPALSTGGSATVGLIIILCGILTAVAPFIYAARSGDFFTVIVSIVALVACFALLAYSRTVIDMVLAAIVYFTSAFISVVMYSTGQITAAITKGARGSLIQERPVAERSFR